MKLIFHGPSTPQLLCHKNSHKHATIGYYDNTNITSHTAFRPVSHPTDISVPGTLLEIVAAIKTTGMHKWECVPRASSNSIAPWKAYELNQTFQPHVLCTAPCVVRGMLFLVNIELYLGFQELFFIDIFSVCMPTKIGISLMIFWSCHLLIKCLEKATNLVSLEVCMLLIWDLCNQHSYVSK